ncbi:hypothetical protein DRP05_06130 [Archaeoglobales archaeon]|nr:MAG: hypothetical protein DRP05_06130 [Archaeoglobales archaeon]
MKKIVVKDGVRYYPYNYKNENEKELEDLFKEHVKYIFGENSLFFEGTKIKTEHSGIGTIPDGFVLLLEDRKWYIVEIELSTHQIFSHIVPQITKFNIAIKNTSERLKLIDTFYNLIQKDIELKYKITKMGVDDELYKTLKDTLDKSPESIVIVIDKITSELREVQDLPFETIVLEFKTYCRENVGL